jgi:peptide/nickel transport system substrate-binding protein
MLPVALGVESRVAEISGPKIDEIVFSIAPRFGLTVEKAALRARQIDMIPNIWSLGDAEDLTADPNIRVYKSPGGSLGMACLFFNCRRSPFDDVEFRKAMSCLVNREYMAKTVLEEWAEPLDTFIPPASNEWTSPNASANKFDVEKAGRILNDAGYRIDSQTQKRLDPKTGTPLRTITVVSPPIGKSPDLWTAAYTTCFYANSVGISTTQVTFADYQLTEKTMKERDFDICVLDITLGHAPFGLFALLHSSRDKLWTTAYPGIHDSDLDKSLESLWFGIKKTEVLQASRDVQKRLASIVPYVPMYSTYEIAAISPEWEGAVNMRGYGVLNPWTYVNIHKAESSLGGRFVQSLKGPIESLNPCIATGNEWRILQQIYSPLLTVDPTTLEEVPVLAKGWEIETMTMTSGKTGMKLTFKLAEGLYWHDGEPFTAEDIKFSIEYLQSNKVPAFEALLSNITRVDAPDATTLRLYLTDTGYRYLHQFAWITFLPKHIWKDVKDYRTFRPWEEPHPTIKGLTKLVGQGPFLFRNTDLKTYARVVWNPLFFKKQPERPSSLERMSVSQSASVGDILNVKYRVLDYTRQPVTDPDTNFKLRVRRTDGTRVLDSPVTYASGAFEGKIDTGKIGAGEYVCEFVAAPYGLDSFTLTVQQPLWIFGSMAAVAMSSVVVIILVLRRRHHSKQLSTKGSAH